MTITIPSQLSDGDLAARLETLAGGEREATALLIAHLAEFGARRLCLGAGFSSLFNYCCEGDPAQIMERALRLLVEDLRRKKYAATRRPRASHDTTPGGRAVAAKVRRVVGSRDDGRCTFGGKDGRRCNERGFIEFHHDEPYGIGGESTVGNIKLLCRAHNAYESERFYGWGPFPRSRTLPGKSRSPRGAAAGGGEIGDRMRSP